MSRRTFSLQINKITAHKELCELCASCEEALCADAHSVRVASFELSVTERDYASSSCPPVPLPFII